ncbi:MAG: glycine zipper 2TM domain-containing protein [Gammaproteobacteria bacterium]|nr:glycine zipper 2TM domain-containing protein [Gammaproteobacteria bacterium]
MTIALVGAILAIPVVSVAQTQDKIVYANVLNRNPIMEQVQIAEPRRVCREQQVVSQNAKSYTPSIVGGVIGGALGTQFGHGTGKKLATIGGAAIGASVGRDIQNKQGGHTVVQEVCHEETGYRYEDRVIGWRVTYEYDGQPYITRTASDPGDTIKLHVLIQPES